MMLKKLKIFIVLILIAFAVAPLALAKDANVKYDIILPPAWSFGVVFGGYTNQEQTIEWVKKLIDEDYPIDAYWIDSTFWDSRGESRGAWGKGPKGYLDFVGDKEAFADTKLMWQSLENYNVKAGIWIWNSIFEKGNEGIYKDFKDRGFFKKTYHEKEGWHNAGNNTMAGDIDFENAEAVAYFKSKLKPFFDNGLDFLKLDRNSELAYLKTCFEMTQDFGAETKGRGFILSHAADIKNPDFTKYPIKWSGDAKIAWSEPYNLEKWWVRNVGLKENIQFLTDKSLPFFNVPFLSNDTGGYELFSSKDHGDELYIRWTQFSCFNSVMHVFGSRHVAGHNMPFNFSQDAQENFKLYTHLRMRLFPYIYNYAHIARKTGMKMVQPVGDNLHQYFFGRDFLVAPVYEKGKETMTIKLPADSDWVDYWSYQQYKAGETIEYPTPLLRLPLLVRAGAIIPMRDYARSVELGTNNKLTLDIYPAKKKSSFTLYEDDGLSNDYIQGKIAATTFAVEQADEITTVTVGQTKGKYTGQSNHRTYIIKVNVIKDPAIVTLDGGKLDSAKSRLQFNNCSAGYYYDGAKHITLVKFSTPIDKTKTVIIDTDKKRKRKI